jgi:hypothetical protein
MGAKMKMEVKKDERSAIDLLESRGYLVVCFTPEEVEVAETFGHDYNDMQDYLISHANETFSFDGGSDGS